MQENKKKKGNYWKQEVLENVASAHQKAPLSLNKQKYLTLQVNLRIS